MANYLDKTGLSYLWSKLKEKFNTMMAETYKSGVNCVAGKYYTFNNKLYLCTKNTDGTIAVTNTTYFTNTTVGEELSNIKDSNLDATATLEENVDFICPTDGYFTGMINFTGAGNNRCIYMHVNSYTIGRISVDAYNYSQNSIFVKKGSVIKYIFGVALTDSEKSKIKVTFRYSNRKDLKL